MDKLYHALNYKIIDYKSPVPFGNRKAALIGWYNKDGLYCQSDVCPLPGYSKETLEDVILQIEALKHGSVDDDMIHPSLHFALHHPDIQGSKMKDQRYQALIHSKNFDTIRDNLKGFRTVKIKTSGLETQKIIELIERLKTHTMIRLDAQRQALDPNLALYLIHNSQAYDYIEEPLVTSKNLSGLKIALDETLYLEKAKPLDFEPVALVYKPTLCGGLKRIKDFYPDLPLIMSSCFETSLGLKRLCLLHQTLYKDQDTCLGLDTFPLEEPQAYLIKKAPYVIYPPE